MLEHFHGVFLSLSQSIFSNRSKKKVSYHYQKRYVKARQKTRVVGKFPELKGGGGDCVRVKF